MKKLYSVVLVVLFYLNASAQILNLPPRQSNALSGKQFEATISSPSLSLTTRENMIYTQVSTGNVPDFYRHLKSVASSAVINSQTQTVVYYVIPDMLAIGHDTDYFLCPMSPMLATKIGNLTGCTLPTRKMVDDIWTTATVKLAPQPIPPSSQMSTVPVFATHDSMVWTQRQPLLAAHPLGELVSGDKKDVVISNLIYSTANRVCIYGWIQTNGSPIQPLTNVHADTYMDYSHGIRLVQDTCMLDGTTVTTIQNVLESSTLNPILSDEGTISQPWYPYFATSTNEQLADDLQMLIYPNPSKGKFQVSSFKYQITEIEMYNVCGEKVYQSIIPRINNSIIDLNEMMSGIYFLSLKTEQGIITQKLIINK
jgi:hypothetical protein